MTSLTLAGQHIANSALVDVEHGQQIPLADDANQAVARVEHRRLMNALFEEDSPGPFDRVIAGHRDHLALHDLVGMVERTAIMIRAQHLAVGADGLRSRGAGWEWLLFPGDWLDSGAGEDPWDLTESFESAAEDGTTQAIY
jgi:hypothetical protein